MDNPRRAVTRRRRLRNLKGALLASTMVLSPAGLQGCVGGADLLSDLLDIFSPRPEAAPSPTSEEHHREEARDPAMGDMLGAVGAVLLTAIPPGGPGPGASENPKPPTYRPVPRSNAAERPPGPASPDPEPPGTDDPPAPSPDLVPVPLQRPDESGPEEPVEPQRETSGEVATRSSTGFQPISSQASDGQCLLWIGGECQDIDPAQQTSA